MKRDNVLLNTLQVAKSCSSLVHADLWMSYFTRPSLKAAWILTENIFFCPDSPQLILFILHYFHFPVFLLHILSSVCTGHGGRIISWDKKVKFGFLNKSDIQVNWKGWGVKTRFDESSVCWDQCLACVYGYLI